jgi:hypothetical protein
MKKLFFALLGVLLWGGAWAQMPQKVTIVKGETSSFVLKATAFSLNGDRHIIDLSIPQHCVGTIIAFSTSRGSENNTAVNLMSAFSSLEPHAAIGMTVVKQLLSATGNPPGDSPVNMYRYRNTDDAYNFYNCQDIGCVPGASYAEENMLYSKQLYNANQTKSVVFKNASKMKSVSVSFEVVYLVQEKTETVLGVAARQDFKGSIFTQISRSKLKSKISEEQGHDLAECVAYKTLEKYKTTEAIAAAPQYQIKIVIKNAFKNCSEELGIDIAEGDLEVADNTYSKPKAVAAVSNNTQSEYFEFMKIFLCHYLPTKSGLSTTETENLLSCMVEKAVKGHPIKDDFISWYSDSRDDFIKTITLDRERCTKDLGLKSLN